MAQPLYFLPDLRAAEIASVPLARPVLAARGLLDVFADVPLDADHLAVNELKGRGPGDKAGLVLTYVAPGGSVPNRCGYYPDEQTWTPIGDGSLVWIGINPADPPREKDMRRGRRFPGYPVELSALNNGPAEQFQIPIIRRDGGGTTLPTDLTWDATGKLIEPLKPAYQSYWDDSAEVASWLFGDVSGGQTFGGPTFSKGRALELAVKALGLNYRYGRMEQRVLRYIDSTNYLALLGASVDYVSVQERLQKKTATSPDTPNTEPGSPAA